MWMLCIFFYIVIKYDFYFCKYLLEILFFKKKVWIKVDKYYCKLNVVIVSIKFVYLVYVFEKKIEMIIVCICMLIVGYVDV